MRYVKPILLSKLGKNVVDFFELGQFEGIAKLRITECRFANAMVLFIFALNGEWPKPWCLSRYGLKALIHEHEPHV